MRVAFLGTGDFGAPSLHALVAAGVEITLCVSQPDRPRGRGRQLQPSPIRAAADALRIPHVQAEDVNALPPDELLGGAELAFVAAFGQKIAPRLLASAPRGFVNLHASLLPRYRGAAPFQWAIIQGETVTGVTVFQLDADWDAGPILGRRETEIGELETASELHDRLAQLGAPLAVETVTRIAAGHATPLPQDPRAASRAPKLRKSDGIVDWAASAFTVQRRIHGMWSWPAAATDVLLPGGARLRLQIARAARLDESELPPDAGLAELHPDGLVRCGSGGVRLLEVKPAGGRLMALADFVNGRKLGEPVRLLTPVE